MRIGWQGYAGWSRSGRRLPGAADSRAGFGNACFFNLFARKCGSIAAAFGADGTDVVVESAGVAATVKTNRR